MTLRSIIEVEQAGIAQVHSRDAPAGNLPADGVRLRVDSFALTANNVTYAKVASQLGYWSLFPAAPDRGIVPVWGHATVVQSRSADVLVGERMFGLLPMASHLDIVAGKVAATAVVDTSSHRSAMSPFYNTYARLGDVAPSDRTRAHVRETFQPLFATAFLIEQRLREADWHDADRLIVTSASSKTALALAHLTARRSPGVTRIGLTAPSNLEYVRSTGLYHDVVSYDDAALPSAGPAVLVDFAGNTDVRGGIHGHFDTQLRYSCSVGATHSAASLGGAANPLPGPVPQFFFAPAELEIEVARIGAETFQRGLADALRDFGRVATGLVSFDLRDGLPAAQTAYLEILAGRVAPADAIIIRL